MAQKNTTAVITASLNGRYATATVTIVSSESLTAFSCNADTLIAGGNTECVVLLSSPPASDVTITVSTANSVLTVPTAIRVVAGSVSTQFTVTSGLTDKDQQATLTAVLHKSVQVEHLQIIGVKPLSLSCVPTTVTGGAVTTCEGRLTSSNVPVTVDLTLSSSNKAVIVPAAVSIRPLQSAVVFRALTTKVPNAKEVRLTASVGSTSVVEKVTVLPSSEPVLAVPDTVLGHIGRLVRFVISAEDPGRLPLTLSVSGLPAGATFDLSTGTVEWTPQVSQAGSHNVTFTATNSAHLSCAQGRPGHRRLGQASHILCRKCRNVF